MTSGFSRWLEPARYRRRLLTSANRSLLPYLDRLCAPQASAPLSFPPVFFLGAPRSGSTLMIQAVATALDVAYLSNVHCQWYGMPALAERLFKPLAQRPESDFRSQHGATSAGSAPAECGRWWYRFFRRYPNYVPLEAVSSEAMEDFRRSLAALTRVAGKPVVFKNLYAALRLEPIVTFVPESLFIVTRRSLLANGQSLLETRRQVYGDYATWWSMEPPGVDDLRKLPVHEQVIEQVRAIHNTIETDLDRMGVGAERIFYLDYETFCAAPEQAVTDLQVFLRGHGVDVRRLHSLPDAFPVSSAIRIDPTLYKRMADYVASL